MVYCKTERAQTEQSRNILHGKAGRLACDFPVNKKLIKKLITV
jgi:hypothetical protein